MPDVIIVGSDGTEHIFPDGFDPKKAAAIVRGQSAPASEATADTRGAVERFVAPLLPSTTAKDYIDGPLYAIRHPIDSARLIKDSVASDPVGAIPVVGNVKRAMQDVGEGNYAGAAGETVAALSPRARKKVRVPVGAATSATGRAIQAVAESKPVQSISGLTSAGEMVMKGDYLKAAAAAVAPTLLKYTGKGIASVGDLLQRGEVAASKAQAANPKISLNASDVIRIKALMDQGVPQGTAVSTVMNLRAKGLLPRSAPIVEPAPIAEVAPVAKPTFEPKTFVPNQKALNEAALARRRAAYQAQQGAP